jgi:hypothetical protein
MAKPEPPAPIVADLNTVCGDGRCGNGPARFMGNL